MIAARPVGVAVAVLFTTLPRTVLSGLAEADVHEGTRRVERAIVNSGYRRPT